MLTLSDCSPKIDSQNPANPQIPRHRGVVGYQIIMASLPHKRTGTGRIDGAKK
jgi:hypothetical protein